MIEWTVSFPMRQFFAILRMPGLHIPFDPARRVRCAKTRNSFGDSAASSSVECRKINGLAPSILKSVGLFALRLTALSLK